jgi:hypothetical protein
MSRPRPQGDIIMGYRESKNDNESTIMECPEGCTEIVLPYPGKAPYEMILAFRGVRGRVIRKGHRISVNRGGTLHIVKDK